MYIAIDFTDLMLLQQCIVYRTQADQVLRVKNILSCTKQCCVKIWPNGKTIPYVLVKE